MQLFTLPVNSGSNRITIPPRIVALVLCALLATTGVAEDWPTWRGPDLTGVSPSKGVPTSWSKDLNVQWRLPLPGPAGSTPVITGDRIFLTSVDQQDLVLLCVSRSGKQLWRRAITKGNKNVRGDEGNYASPSPVTDGKQVFAAFGNGVVAAFDLEGKEFWRVDLQERYGKFRIQFGWSSTPVLHDGTLYFQLVHGDGKATTSEARIVALSAADGTEVWTAERDTDAWNENEHSYASSMIYPFGDEPYLITHGADFAIGTDFKTGKELWRLSGLNPQNDPRRPYHRTLRFVASPGIGEGVIVVPTAKNGPVVAIKPDGEGQIDWKSDSVLWTLPSGTPDVPSPLVHDGIAYLCRENGNLMAVDARTGKQLYLERTHRNRHRASPVYADGHIFLTSRDGLVTVVKAGRTFEIVSQNRIDEPISSSPAIADGVIYLRSFNALYAISK